MDRILVRLPHQLEFVFPAIATVQHYISAIQKQAQCGQRDPMFGMRIEVQDESHLFLAPMLDRLEWWVNNGEVYWRMDWDCVLDFRDLDRPMAMAKAGNRHVAEIWGTMFGANPKKVPYLGYLVMKLIPPKFDVLIDMELESATDLAGFFWNNLPHLNVGYCKVVGLRLSQMFDRLNETKCYIGPRSEASYMAATMGKAVIECYSDDVPVWWLQKPRCDIYGLVYGKDFSAETIWWTVKELEETIWPISTTKNPDVMVPEEQRVSIVENAGVR